jgi:hypothetical protein
MWHEMGRHLNLVLVAIPHQELLWSYITITLHILHPYGIFHLLDHDSNNSNNNANSCDTEPYYMGVLYYVCKPCLLFVDVVWV